MIINIIIIKLIIFLLYFEQIFPEDLNLQILEEIFSNFSSLYKFQIKRFQKLISDLTNFGFSLDTFLKSFIPTSSLKNSQNEDFETNFSLDENAEIKISIKSFSKTRKSCGNLLAGKIEKTNLEDETFSNQPRKSCGDFLTCYTNAGDCRKTFSNEQNLMIEKFTNVYFDFITSKGNENFKIYKNMIKILAD